MMINRRTFVTTAIAGLVMPTQAFATIELGEKSLTTLSDGNLVLPQSLPEDHADDAKALLEAAGMSLDERNPPCNCSFLREGDRTILFDAGSGPNFMPSAGKLMASLEDAGVDPASITDVIFTHAHPDHLWGIIDDFDEIAFPDANLHVGRTEWDYWRADGTLEQIGEARQMFVVGARNRFDAIEERVQLFDDGAEVVPGVEAMMTPGHTPGHMSFAVHSGSDYAMVIGDAAIHPVLSFARPDWHSGSDQDPELGAKTRVSLLDRLATDKAQIAGFHLPDGGMGRVEVADSGYRFVQS